jgi:hypothetical protein
MPLPSVGSLSLADSARAAPAQSARGSVVRLYYTGEAGLFHVRLIALSSASVVGASRRSRFLVVGQKMRAQDWGTKGFIEGSKLALIYEDCAMPQTDSRSLQQIKRETEQTRLGLSDTVEQLKSSVAETASDIRHRISPDAIKAEVSGYIKSRGEQFVNDITVAARRNPMQAVAVGASVAYPLLRLARAVPLPVLMVGAGLFFAGSKAGQSATQKASDMAADLSDEVGRRARALGDQVGETTAAAKTYVSDQLDRAGAAMSGGTEQVNRVAEAAGATLSAGSQSLQDRAALLAGSLARRATDIKEDGLRAAGSGAATVHDIASGAAAAARHAASTTADAGLDAAKAARDKASDLASSGMDAVQTAREKASDFADRAGKTVFQTIEQNPLLVAGVGLLLGGLIASALPRSEIEDDLVGDASTAVKRRAQAAASQGIESAGKAMEEVYDQASRRAQAEGFGADGIGKAAQDLGQRVRRVAEAAVTTAFEPEEENHQPGNHGDTHNG